MHQWNEEEGGLKSNKQNITYILLGVTKSYLQIHVNKLLF